MRPLRILIACYSQTGQLRRLLEAIAAPLAASGAQVTWLDIRPRAPHPFPWTMDDFFQVFPESVTEQAEPLEPPAFPDGQSWDLVLLGYQPWFLSPSLPVTSFLQHPEVRARLSGIPWVAVCGCRNMWHSAGERVEEGIRALGGTPAGHIVFQDKHSNLVSLLTLLHWLKTGRRERRWGVLPMPGVADDDIASASRFAASLAHAHAANAWGSLQPRLDALGARDMPPELALMDRRGKAIFRVWARVVLAARTAPQRARRLKAFKAYLFAVVFTASPLVWAATRMWLAVSGKRTSTAPVSRRA